MELRLLTKQMMLLTNLLRGYSAEIGRESWERFAVVLHAQADTITALIHAEAGPRRKHKAQQAFTSLSETLHDYFVPHLQIAA